jgi:hypothetical protein
MVAKYTGFVVVCGITLYVFHISTLISYLVKLYCAVMFYVLLSCLFYLFAICNILYIKSDFVIGQWAIQSARK